MNLQESSKFTKRKPSKFLNVLLMLVALLPGHQIAIQQSKPAGGELQHAVVSVQPLVGPPRGDDANSGKLTINLPDGTIDFETQFHDSRYLAVITLIGGMGTILVLMAQLSKALKQDDAYEHITLIDDEYDKCVSSEPLINNFVEKIDSRNKKPISQEDYTTKTINYLTKQIKSFVSNEDSKKQLKALEEGRRRLINCFEVADKKLSDWKNQFGSAFPHVLIESADIIISDLRKLVNATYSSSVTLQDIKNSQTKIDSLRIAVQREVETIPGIKFST